MRSLFAGLLGVLLATPLAAQQQADTEKKPNPYLDMPAPELRQRLADMEAVHQESWYQVEALVFARVNPVSREYWRLDQEPEFAPNPIYLAGMPRPDSPQPSGMPMDAPGEAAGNDTPDIDVPLLPEEADEIDRAAAEHGAWQPLDEQALADGKTLAAMRERMESRGSYRILFHEAWRQPIRERGRAFAIHVEGGQRLQPLEEDFLLTPLNPAEDEPEPLQQETPMDEEPGAGASMEAAAEAEPVKDRSFPEMRGELKLHLARYLHVEPNLWFTDKTGDGQRFHVTIEQHRRMRSEELHYIDHPLFGLVLYLKPWKTPEQEEAKLMEKALEKQMKREDG